MGTIPCQAIYQYISFLIYEPMLMRIDDKTIPGTIMANRSDNIYIARLDDTYYTYFIICWKNVLIRVFYFWSKIKYVTYVIRHKNVINYLI